MATSRHFASCVRAAASILAALLATATIPDCGGYGEVSPAAYDYATALYSITNRRAEDKLEAIGEQIKSARETGNLSQQEAEWLEAILSDARHGNWESAAKACRTMMEDQAGN